MQTAVELRAKLEEQPQDPTLDTSTPQDAENEEAERESARKYEDRRRTTWYTKSGDNEGTMGGNGREVIWRPEDESQGERYVVSVGR